MMLRRSVARLAALGTELQPPPDFGEMGTQQVEVSKRYWFPAHLEPIGANYPEYRRGQTMWIHQCRPYHKLDWKPRLLAILWSVGFTPVDWPPKVRDRRNAIEAEWKRYWFCIDGYNFWMYNTLLTFMILISVWHIMKDHSDISLYKILWSWWKPYLVAMRFDHYDYRLEGTPWQARGGGRYTYGRYRIMDSAGAIWGYNSFRHRVGPYAWWQANSPYNNPYARGTKRL